MSTKGWLSIGSPNYECSKYLLAAICGQCKNCTGKPTKFFMRKNVMDVGPMKCCSEYVLLAWIDVDHWQEISYEDVVVIEVHRS
jgi:hypothetical protein